MSPVEIDGRLRARNARLEVLGLVGQGEVTLAAVVVQLRWQGFADREIGAAIDLLLDQGVLVRGRGNIVRRYLAP